MSVFDRHHIPFPPELPPIEIPPDPNDFDACAAKIPKAQLGQDSWGPYIILKEDSIAPITMLPGDTLNLTLDFCYTWTAWGVKQNLQDRVFTHQINTDQPMTYNHVIVLRYKEFHGVQNAIVWVVGYREPNQ